MVVLKGTETQTSVLEVKAALRALGQFWGQCTQPWGSDNSGS